MSCRATFALLMILAFTFAASMSRANSTDELQIYFIDVEGGQSTLIVTPGGHSLLIDAGFPAGGTFESTPGNPGDARDANRVLAAARAAGLKQIDFFLSTHFHGDHLGGVPELSQLIPIRTFVDHGRPSPDVDVTSPGSMALFREYERVRQAGQHLTPKPGDHIPLNGAQIEVVSAAGETLSHPLPQAGGISPRCPAAAAPAGEPHENPRSTGVLVSFGRFRFLDLGDLTGEPLWRLACPQNKIGSVDVYLVTHHGGPDAAEPSILAAFAPRVAILNNGLKKGGAPITFETLRQEMGPATTWQLHWSEAAGKANFAPAHIANLDESTAYGISLRARRDGSFAVSNARTGTTEQLPPTP